MSDSSAFGFGKFIQGFDFLQNLGKAGAASPGPSPFAHWVAPTVSVEEIDKRIEELRSVQFWLEQNSKALAATVQALEVQKMTLSTLKGMNVNLQDMAQAFQTATAAATAASGTAATAAWPMPAAAPAPTATSPEGAAAQTTPPASPPPRAEASAADAKQGAHTDAPQDASTALAMQWWGALTQQFQQIAQQAMQEPEQRKAMLQATQMSANLAKAAVQTAGDMVRQAAAPAGARKATAPAASPGRASATPQKTAPSTAAPKAAAKRAPAAKKAASADKKTTGTAAKKPAVAATKTVVRKPRAR